MFKEPKPKRPEETTPPKPKVTKVKTHLYKVVAKGGLNVRASRQKKKTNIVAVVKYGTILNVTDTPQGGWAKVMYGGKTRFVASKYLRKVK